MDSLNTTQDNAPIVFGLVACALLGLPTPNKLPNCPVSAKNVLFGEDDTDAQDSNEEF